MALALAACGGGDAELASPDLTSVPSSTTPETTTPPPSEPGPPTSAPRPGRTTTSSPPRPAPTSPPATARPSELTNIQLRVTRVATLVEPLAMAVRGGDGALYFAEKRGRVRAVRNGEVDPTSVLDISAEVSTGAEQGLLGLVFSPDGGRLYINFTDTKGDTHIVEFAMAGGTADPATRRELLFIDQPYANHNGGHLVFGPDGKLWIGMGDGGGGGDPQDNGQSLGTLLGKMLRIDPQPGGGLPYTIPGDNPFVGTSGARGEIWAYGLRNPWRYSFDRATGDLWIGDVGQNAREEVNFQAAGAPGGQNYGWARLEGSRTYSGRAPANAVPPIFDYGRAGGNCAVTGGYVYRGNRIGGLVGAYLFADYCGGQLRAIRQGGGQVVDERIFSTTVRLLAAFGQDQSGELYVLSLEGGVFRIDPG